MATATSAAATNPPEDELDDILNDIIDDEDLFDTSNIRAQVEPQQQQRNTSTKNTNLGIDEEIKIEKKRRPIPKLDEDRLLSTAGISRLKRISKDRLRFKGKGHEYGDIARMLNMYQLWLDDLYPRAKFADGLAMIEALGHKKRMHMMRKEWIYENKPKNSADTDSENEDAAAQPAAPVESIEKDTERMEGLQLNNVGNESGLPRRVQEEPTRHVEESGQAFDDDGLPDDDDLDALLAEAADPETTTRSTQKHPEEAPPEDDMFADDIAAMAEMDDMW